MLYVSSVSSLFVLQETIVAATTSGDVVSIATDGTLTVLEQVRDNIPAQSQGSCYLSS